MAQRFRLVKEGLSEVEWVDALFERMFKDVPMRRARVRNTNTREPMGGPVRVSRVSGDGFRVVEGCGDLDFGFRKK